MILKFELRYDGFVIISSICSRLYRLLDTSPKALKQDGSWKFTAEWKSYLILLPLIYKRATTSGLTPLYLCTWILDLVSK